MSVSKKILIIEDEEALSEMYKMKFEQEGYEVLAASDGTEGIDLAKKKKPDLILLDLVLPGMNGYEVLEKLRAAEETKKGKIYILSNLGQSGEIKKGLEDGADGYMVKANLTPSQLAENVKKIFGEQTVGAKKQTMAALPKKEKSGKVEGGNQSMPAGLSVLLIEDEEAIIEMYNLRLTKDGFSVEIAKNGAWGIKRAKEKKFDVIIVDMMMPAMNGYKAIVELKGDERTKNTPVIVLSNSAQDKDVEKAKKLGAASYLLKSSITPARLVREIEKAIK
ncbi:MAG: response regulator [Patescibacteria group bacterium]|nr:response regulator [Patescibacteria group bacterium]